MILVTIGSDRSIFKQGTNARGRIEKQAAMVEQMHIVIFSRRAHGCIEQHAGNLHLYPTNSVSRWLYIYDAIKLGRKIGNIDVVSAQDPFESGLAAWRIAKRGKAMLQMQVHTDLLSPFFSRSSFLNRLRVRLARFLLPRADAVRVVSERIKHSLMALKLRARITVLPVFLDIAAVHVAQPAAREQFAQYNPLMLVAARLEPEKNVALALRACPIILKSFPDAGLLIAGDGSQKEILVHLAQTLGIEKHIVFLGHRTDTFSLYKISDVVLSTSYYEGYGASIVEALAAGAPVVSTDVGVAREAGARIASEKEYAQAVVQTLRVDKKGELHLPVLSGEEWTKQWRASLPQ